MARAITYFDKARSLAAALMIAAGIAAIVGSLLDWVTIEPPRVLPASERPKAIPYSGLDAGDGWWTLAVGIVLVVAGFLLAATRRRAWLWLGFVGCIIAGGIAFADFNAVGTLDSELSQRLDVVGDPDPAIGIMLVAAAALVGIIGIGVGFAATPREEIGG